MNFASNQAYNIPSQQINPLAPRQFPNMMKTDPHQRVPLGTGDKECKVFVDELDFPPNCNIAGLLVGPFGGNIKRLEAHGARCLMQGKGVKRGDDATVAALQSPGQTLRAIHSSARSFEEPLHVLVNYRQDLQVKHVETTIHLIAEETFERARRGLPHFKHAPPKQAIDVLYHLHVLTGAVQDGFWMYPPPEDVVPLPGSGYLSPTPPYYRGYFLPVMDLFRAYESFFGYPLNLEIFFDTYRREGIISFIRSIPHILTLTESFTTVCPTQPSTLRYRHIIELDRIFRERVQRMPIQGSNWRRYMLPRFRPGKSRKRRSICSVDKHSHAILKAVYDIVDRHGGEMPFRILERQFFEIYNLDLVDTLPEFGGLFVFLKSYYDVFTLEHKNINLIVKNTLSPDLLDDFLHKDYTEVRAKRLKKETETSAKDVPGIANSEAKTEKLSGLTFDVLQFAASDEGKRKLIGMPRYWVINQKLCSTIYVFSEPIKNQNKILASLGNHVQQIELTSRIENWFEVNLPIAPFYGYIYALELGDLEQRDRSVYYKAWLIPAPGTLRSYYKALHELDEENFLKREYEIIKARERGLHELEECVMGQKMKKEEKRDPDDGKIDFGELNSSNILEMVHRKKKQQIRIALRDARVELSPARPYGDLFIEALRISLFMVYSLRSEPTKKTWADDPEQPDDLGVMPLECLMCDCFDENLRMAMPDGDQAESLLIDYLNYEPVRDRYGIFGSYSIFRFMKTLKSFDKVRQLVG